MALIMNIKGAPGADGLSILSGAIDPTTEGVDGEFYLNTATSTLFGPKATTWPTGVSLVGTPGAAGTTWYNQAGTPDDITGADGDYDLNTTTGDVYVKVAGSWGVGS